MGDKYTLAPLGRVKCAAKTIDEVPSEGIPSEVEIYEPFRDAMLGVEPGDFLYVITIFHLADASVHQGSEGTEHAQGAFSIRSSCRPNRIGMTLSKVVSVTKSSIRFEWLDFVDGTPVIDIKRYNWRWECALTSRRLDRRFIEQQISEEKLSYVMERAARIFHGEQCQGTKNAGLLAAQLVHEWDLSLSAMPFHIYVRGNGHLLDSVMAISGATFGNGRLDYDPDDSESVLILTMDGHTWKATIKDNDDKWIIEQQS